ncbi:hypothetical protein SAY87_000421 [Trapa incisa]|uniref:Uncharacterized protein n=1 Tax=Trapa incisa TaxID=236973 RepID=A0AAN7JGY5_9MYRT|nr:hypothetical protein SAY87_000421 [Trapa incisa]
MDVIILADGSKQVRRVNLMEKPKGRWIKVPTGEIRTSMSGRSRKKWNSPCLSMKVGNGREGLSLRVSRLDGRNEFKMHQH